ncbi:TPA: hypothetical protein ACX6RX_003210 [Photobacterium damselae]
MSLITTALAIGKVLGLDNLIEHWFSGNQGKAVAETIISTAEKITGKTNPDEILCSLQSTEFAASLKMALIDQQTELEKMAFDDKKDARFAQTKVLEQDDRFSKRFIYYYAAFWGIVAAVYIFAVTFVIIPKENSRFADLILGFLLGTVIGGTISYFYGSSLKQSPNKQIATK